MNCRRSRTALLAAVTAAILSTAALLAADIAGAPARHLFPLLLPLGALWALVPITLTLDARASGRGDGRQIPTDAPDRDRDGWVPETHRHHDKHEGR